MISKLKPITFVDHFVTALSYETVSKAEILNEVILVTNPLYVAQTDVAVASGVTSLYLDNSVFYSLF